MVKYQIINCGEIVATISLPNDMLNDEVLSYAFSKHMISAYDYLYGDVKRI